VPFAPGVGVDVDLVAVLGEAVDESDDAGGAGEDGAPLFEGKVGRDDRRAVLVAAADDFEEDVGGAAVAREVAELVEDQCCRSPRMTSQRPISRRQREGEWRVTSATGIAWAGNWQSRWVMVSTRPRRGHRHGVGPGNG
jgi:hypothetical protein